jgi:hypothetical protein
MSKIHIDYDSDSSCYVELSDGSFNIYVPREELISLMDRLSLVASGMMFLNEGELWVCGHCFRVAHITDGATGQRISCSKCGTSYWRRDNG